MGRSFRASLLLLLSASFSIGLTRDAAAQERRVQNEQIEAEHLRYPVTAPTNNGAYGIYNKMPEEIRRSAIFARMMHQYQSVAGESGRYDMEARVREFEASQQDLRSNSVALKGAGHNQLFGDAWVNIGMHDTGGCTNAIAIHPANSNIIYAGAAGGGVWKTTNGGSSWTALTDDVIPNLAVASLAIDPLNPNTIYAGSGDGFPSVDALSGSGLYRSTNAGLDWERIGATVLKGTIIKVLAHPTKSGYLYASQYDGGTLGLYRSTNGGTNWSKVAGTGAVVWDVTFGAIINNTAIMYLVEGNNIGGSARGVGVYKSANDGATWGKLANIFPVGDTLIGRAAIECPAKATNKVFVLAAKPDGKMHGLYKSTNTGSTWSKIASVPSTLFQPSAQLSAQGWYDLCMDVSPNSTNNDTILVGGVEAYYTFDGGANWNEYSGYNLDDRFTPHVDHHAIAMDPRNPKRIFIGTDGGIYLSVNAGQNWSYKSGGYSTMRFYHVGLDDNNANVSWVGAQDQGTWRHYKGNNLTGLKLGGDGFQPLVSHTTSNTVYAENPFGNLSKTTNASYFVGIGQGAFNDDADWDAPFAMSAKNSAHLFLGRAKLWRSLDNGQSWDSISPSFDSALYDPNIKTLCISPANENVLWLGFVSGRIMFSNNGGNTWASRSSGTPSVLVSSIVQPQNNQNFAVASFMSNSTTQARVMYTTNQGVSWKNASGTGTKILRGVPVRAIALDSVNPTRTWYAATDNGMYYTLDSGKTWGIAGSGIGLTPCWDVQVHKNKATIRVATHGRGLWEANANVLPVELSSLEAEKTDAGTLLKWHTDSEKNNSGFYVLRSYNYEPFESIGFVTGAVNSSLRRDYSFVDSKTDDGIYLFQLRQVDLDGSESFSNHVEIKYGRENLALQQNFPNPFRIVQGVGETRIAYTIPAESEVRVRVYNAIGAMVRDFPLGMQKEGSHELIWNGRDAAGTQLASGAYTYSLEVTGQPILWKKLLLLTH